jgi:hypothetical protein
MLLFTETEPPTNVWSLSDGRGVTEEWDGMYRDWKEEFEPFLDYVLLHV